MSVILQDIVNEVKEKGPANQKLRNGQMGSSFVIPFPVKTLQNHPLDRHF